MTELVRASDLIGRPIVTIDGGDDVGEVRDIVYDPETRRLLGFTLNARGWFRGRSKDVLEASEVKGIGDTAVMIADEAALSVPDDVPAPLAGASPARNVLEDRVITEAGVDLGVVAGLVLQIDDPVEAVGYELADDRGDHRFIPIEAATSVSGGTLVVEPWAAEFVQQDLSGFGAAVDSFRRRHRQRRSEADPDRGVPPARGDDVGRVDEGRVERDVDAVRGGGR
jgi:uncharacterized protein YrrD